MKSSVLEVANIADLGWPLLALLTKPFNAPNRDFDWVHAEG
jgi:hypothetical protein